jgi:hypothetical protein
LTILVSGMIAGDPHQGGATWSILQFILGLRRLGHVVYLVEPVAGKESDVSSAYFRLIVAEFGLETSAALLTANRQTIGLSYEGLLDIASRADVLLNVSGMLTDAELIERIPARVYLDLDPAFNQLWHAAEGIDMRFDKHTHFVTVGQAIGTAECPVPACGRQWIAAVPPIVLEHWPVADRIDHDAFTTVGNWRGYGSVTYQGVFYGQKAHSLRPMIELPRRTQAKFALALAIHPAEEKDLQALAANGWQLLDPVRVAGTPDDYRRFIQGSRAEFGIAKGGYVASRCGWFSDRSVCYLASGRPVVAQETGFSRYVPTGEGLFAFATQDDVLAGIDAIASDYPRHCRAARRLAEELFDSDRVLTGLLRRIGAVP